MKKKFIWNKKKEKILYAPKSEKLFGVPPEELEPTIIYHTVDNFIVHKSAKNGQSSFRITKSLLDSLIDTSIKIKKQPKLIISIGVRDGEYILTCSITKK
mgnify:CR=1 FL=1